MRRKDREIKDLDKILSILDRASTLHISFSDEKGQYIVPLCYGYELTNGKLTLFAHSASEGRKVNAFRANSEVAAAISIFHEYAFANGEWTCLYESIIGQGFAYEITDGEEKSKAMRCIMKRSVNKDILLPPEALKNTAIFTFKLDWYSAKGNI